MRKKKTIEYDHKSSISFLGTMQTICSLMAGFAFTGMIVALTGIGYPSTLISQFVLAILFSAMTIFLIALVELHFLNLLVSIRSPKQIVPLYPNRNRRIESLLFVGIFLVTFSISVMFVLRNLIMLFIFSICATILGYVWFYFKLWKPTRKKLKLEKVI